MGYLFIRFFQEETGSQNSIKTMKIQASIKTISSGMAINSLGIFVSRISGLVRDIMFAKYWGTGDALGAFLVAFTVPNLFRRVFGEGALSEAFVPLFTENLTKNGRQSAYQFAYSVLTVLTVILLIIIGIGVLACGIIDSYLPDTFAQLTLKLSKVLLPYAIFICTSAILAGILNSLNHFSTPAYSPIILNCAMIIALVFICPRLGPKEFNKLLGLAGAVLLAGGVQFLLLVLVLFRFDFFFQFSTKIKFSQIKELFTRVIPGVFSASITQLNVLVDRVFAGWLGGFAVTSLYYSERLIYLPIGIFAVALATACLPEFSRALAEDKAEDMVSAFFYSIRQILYLTLPFVVFIMMLAAPTVNLLFQRGNFNSLSADGTVSAILFYAPGIPAFAAVKILRAGFFSRKDTATPARIACYCLILNILLNTLLIIPLKHCGLALATTISSYVNLFLLSLSFYRTTKSEAFPIANLFAAVTRIAISMLMTGIIIWYVKDYLSYFSDDTILSKVTQCVIPIGIGGIFYLVSSIALGSKEPKEMYAVLISKQRGKFL